MTSCCRPAIVRAASAASSASLVVGRSAARQRLLNAQSQPRILSQSVRTKKTSAKNNNHKAAVSRALRSNSSTTSTGSSNSTPSASGQGIFGLEPVNYATAAAPAICASPPPPPPKPGLAKYTFPISALLTIGVTAYFYVNNQNDSFAYWESMQTGGIPEDDDDDDDDDDDLDDEEE